MVGKSKAKRPIGRCVLDGMIILKSVLKKYDDRMCSKLIVFRIGTVTGSREEGNEILRVV